MDATRNRIKLAGGDYALPIGTTVPVGLTVELHGPATINGNNLYVSGATTLRVRNVVFGLQVSASPAVVSGPMPTVDLEDVTFKDDFDLYLNPAILRARRVKMRSTVGAITPLTGTGELLGSGGATANRGSDIIIEQSTLDAPTFSIVLSNYSSAKITNSVFRNASMSAISFDTTTLASSVSFSTFHNARWVCPSAAAIFTGNNNIFLNETSSPPTNTVLNSSCVHNYSLIKPQATPPSGANNLLNMDPRFVNAANGDFHLVAGSPAIDAADPAATETVDYEGTMRPQGTRRDMGAFEFH